MSSIILKNPIKVTWFSHVCPKQEVRCCVMLYLNYQSKTDITIIMDKNGRWISKKGEVEEPSWWKPPYQVQFLCGSDDDCRVFASQKTTQRAKENIEKYYTVVGILEEITESLVVFERFIPQYFKNATDMYTRLITETKTGEWRMKRNMQWPKVQNSIWKHLTKTFSYELDFYAFCKSRLHKQFLLAKVLGYIWRQNHILLLNFYSKTLSI